MVTNTALDHWAKHPFSKKNPHYRTIATKVKVLGIGDNINDETATKIPDLVLIKPSVAVLSKISMRLMNPNGWYCLKTSVSVLGKSAISLNCKASLASSKDGANVLGANETGGVSVLGSLRVNRECTPVAAATETEKEPAKETGKETEKTTE